MHWAPVSPQYRSFPPTSKLYDAAWTKHTLYNNTTYCFDSTACWTNASAKPHQQWMTPSTVNHLSHYRHRMPSMSTVRQFVSQPVRTSGQPHQHITNKQSTERATKAKQPSAAKKAWTTLEANNLTIDGLECRTHLFVRVALRARGVTQTTALCYLHGNWKTRARALNSA